MGIYMSTINIKNENIVHLAESYYRAMLAKDFDSMGSYLHDNVHFIGPLAEMRGKESVVLAAKNLSKILTEINIRSKFLSGNQVMLVYDFLFSTLNLNLRSAGLLDFTNGKISKIELFYDGRPFEKKKDEIFMQNK